MRRFLAGAALCGFTLVGALPLVGQGVAADSGTAASLRPRFAGGVVWVRSLPISPRELASRITGKPPQELLDSTVTAITTAYLDGVEAERKARGDGTPPSWTTGSGSAKLGLDSRFVYLGPLKVPTMLLGLLPISWPAPNPTEWERQRTLRSMLEDIHVAGSRQSNLSEMAEGVKAVRQERERRREFEANQRRPPPVQKDST